MRVAILAALFALGSRFAGKVLDTALGWASTLLFGRVPADRQLPSSSAITFGSVIWIVLLIGDGSSPDIGTFLLLLVPPQESCPERSSVSAMLDAALLLPAVIGGLALWPSRARAHVPGRSPTIGRGYPLTAPCSPDARVPGRPRRLAQGAGASSTAGPTPTYRSSSRPAPTTRSPPTSTARPGPASTSNPGGAAACPAGAVARRGGRRVGRARTRPDAPAHGTELDILIYRWTCSSRAHPKMMRARAAMASRLTTTSAHITVTAEWQAIEDPESWAGRAGGRPGPRTTDDRPTRRDARLDAIDRSAGDLEVPYEEWETLYRSDSRSSATSEPGLGVRPADPIEQVPAPARPVRSAVRSATRGPPGIVDVAADERDEKAIDRLAWTARAAGRRARGSVASGGDSGARRAGRGSRAAEDSGRPEAVGRARAPVTAKPEIEADPRP